MNIFYYICCGCYTDTRYNEKRDFIIIRNKNRQIYLKGKKY